MDTASTTTKPNPWERMEGEPPRAFAAFVCYRDMPPAERSHNAVVRNRGKSRAEIGRWSSAWDWVARAAAYDADQDRKRLSVLEDERLTAARRQAQLGYAVQEVAVQALAATDPGSLTPTEATRLLGLGVKIERDALDGSVQVNVTASARAMTTKELDAAFAELEALILANVK